MGLKHGSSHCTVGTSYFLWDTSVLNKDLFYWQKYLDSLGQGLLWPKQTPPLFYSSSWKKYVPCRITTGKFIYDENWEARILISQIWKRAKLSSGQEWIEEFWFIMLLNNSLCTHIFGESRTWPILYQCQTCINSWNNKIKLTMQESHIIKYLDDNIAWRIQ